MQKIAKKYIALQSAIIKTGGVDCEKFPDAFFPEEAGVTPEGIREMESIAISMCRRCPVKALCMDYAISAREPYGVWGGTLPSER